MSFEARHQAFSTLFRGKYRGFEQCYKQIHFEACNSTQKRTVFFLANYLYRRSRFEVIIRIKGQWCHAIHSNAENALSAFSSSQFTVSSQRSVLTRLWQVKDVSDTQDGLETTRVENLSLQPRGWRELLSTDDHLFGRQDQIRNPRSIELQV